MIVAYNERFSGTQLRFDREYSLIVYSAKWPSKRSSEKGPHCSSDITAECQQSVGDSTPIPSYLLSRKPPSDDKTLPISLEVDLKIVSGSTMNDDALVSVLELLDANSFRDCLILIDRTKGELLYHSKPLDIFKFHSSILQFVS